MIVYTGTKIIWSAESIEPGIVAMGTSLSEVVEACRSHFRHLLKVAEAEDSSITEFKDGNEIYLIRGDSEVEQTIFIRETSVTRFEIMT